MSEEDRERERKWAREKHEALVWFVSHVRQALEFPMNPKARKAIYDSWRRQYGDDRARGPAKFTEECIKGLASIDKLEVMIRNPPPDNV